MTDRLSDERLKRLREAYSLRSGLSAFEAERECSKDAVSAIDELLALRAKVEVVLAYRPKPKTKPARKRARRKKKADAASRA